MNRWNIILLLALPGALAQAQAVAPSHQEASAPRVVALVPGTCAAVVDGDIVSFDWNPGFDRPEAIAGLHDASLRFLRVGDSEKSLLTRGALTLMAVPARSSRTLAVPPIAAGSNGSYTFYFRVALARTQPGEYHLARASFEPSLSSGYQGPAPSAVNDPARSFFCLTVDSVPETRVR